MGYVQITSPDNLSPHGTRAPELKVDQKTRGSADMPSTRTRLFTVLRSAVLMALGFAMLSDNLWVGGPRPRQAFAQEFDPGADTAGASDVINEDGEDVVTSRLKNDPLLRLRLLSFELTDPEEAAQIQFGIVLSLIVRDNLDDAFEEASEISVAFWRAQALLEVATAFQSAEETFRASEIIDGILERVEPAILFQDNANLLERIADLRFRTRDIAGAISLTDLLPSAATRIQLLLRVVKSKIDDPDATRVERRTLIASLTGLTLQVLSDNSPPRQKVEVLTAVSDIQSQAGDLVGARSTLRKAEEFVRREIDPDAAALLKSMLVGPYIRASVTERAMNIAGTLPAGTVRARALVSAAREVAKAGNTTASLPIFTFAFDEASRIESLSERDDFLKLLVHTQTELDFLPEAYQTALAIADPRQRILALYEMSEVLLGLGRVDLAVRLADFVPQLSMRIRILSSVAISIAFSGRAGEARNLLLTSMTPTGRPIINELISGALDELSEAMLVLSEPSFDIIAFPRIHSLLNQIEDEATRVEALGKIAVIEERLGRHNEARNSVTRAVHSSYPMRDDPSFGSALLSVVRAQLSTGDLYAAFDTAEFITTSSELRPSDYLVDPNQISVLRANRVRKPDELARILIGTVAGRQGEVDLAIRAVRGIEDRSVRASAIGAVAVVVGAQDDVQAERYLGPIAQQIRSLFANTGPMIEELIDEDTDQDLPQSFEADSNAAPFG